VRLRCEHPAQHQPLCFFDLFLQKPDPFHQYCILTKELRTVVQRHRLGLGSVQTRGRSDTTVAMSVEIEGQVFTGFFGANFDADRLRALTHNGRIEWLKFRFNLGSPTGRNNGGL